MAMDFLSFNRVERFGSVDEPIDFPTTHIIDNLVTSGVAGDNSVDVVHLVGEDEVVAVVLGQVSTVSNLG